MGGAAFKGVAHVGPSLLHLWPLLGAPAGASSLSDQKDKLKVIELAAHIAVNRDQQQMIPGALRLFRSSPAFHQKDVLWKRKHRGLQKHGVCGSGRSRKRSGRTAMR